MRSNLRLYVVIIFFFCLYLPRLAAESESLFPDPEATISMDFQDASIKDILKIFSIQSGLNFIASEAVQDRKITLYLDKVPIKETMDKIFKANNLSYELEEDSNIFIVKDWGKPAVETITKVFYLKYHPVSSSSLRKELGDEKNKFKVKTGDIKAILEGSNILSANGKIAEDADTNSLIITDIPSHFPTIEQVIAKLDIPIPQVLIDVEILDVSKNTVDKLGFEFGNNPLTLLMPTASFNGKRGQGANWFLGNLAYRGAEALSSATGAVVWGNTYAQLLDFLRTRTDTKILARPRLLTLNNETAEINITKDEVLEVKPKVETITPTSGSPVTNVTYELKRASDFDFIKQGVGVTLRVTPQINLDINEVTMVINPQASTSSDSIRASGLTVSTASGVTYTYTPAEPEKRETKSIVKVKDGETVILGGLIHSDKQVRTKKLPLLGDIPFVGALFRHKYVLKDTERELLVFITPHIIKDTDMELAQLKKTAAPAREQDIGVLKRKMAIDVNLDSFEKMR